MEYIEQVLDIKTEYKDWEDRKKNTIFSNRSIFF